MANVPLTWSKEYTVRKTSHGTLHVRGSNLPLTFCLRCITLIGCTCKHWAFTSNGLQSSLTQSLTIRWTEFQVTCSKTNLETSSRKCMNPLSGLWNGPRHVLASWIHRSTSISFRVLHAAESDHSYSACSLVATTSTLPHELSSMAGKAHLRTT